MRNACQTDHNSPSSGGGGVFYGESCSVHAVRVHAAHAADAALFHAPFVKVFLSRWVHPHGDPELTIVLFKGVPKDTVSGTWHGSQRRFPPC